MYERVMGDIEDYLRTPVGHPEFLEKYQAIAVNSRQIMDAGPAQFSVFFGVFSFWFMILSCSVRHVFVVLEV